MTPLDAAIIATNMLLAAAAGTARMWAAANVPFRHERLRHMSIGLLAYLYVTGYVVVLAGWVPVLAWSSFFRGVSMLAWPAVWMAPAIGAVRSWRGAAEGAREIVRQANGTADRG